MFLRNAIETKKSRCFFLCQESNIPTCRESFSAVSIPQSGKLHLRRLLKMIRFPQRNPPQVSPNGDRDYINIWIELFTIRSRGPAVRGKQSIESFDHTLKSAFGGVQLNQGNCFLKSYTKVRHSRKAGLRMNRISPALRDCYPR